MELKPGYKRTEVGVIPEDWAVISVGKAGQVLGGRQRSPHQVVANVFDGFLETEDVLEMPFSAHEKERFLLKSGDILLNEGQSIELVGRSAIYRGIPDECCFQNTLIRFRANRSTFIEFAQMVFQHYLSLGVFSSIAVQTTSIAHLGAGRFAALKMPLPPLAEQQTIAEALGDADALIESLEQLVTKKRHFKQGTMQELLTGKLRLQAFASAKPGNKKTEIGVIPEDWEVKSIQEIAAIKTGPFGTLLKAAEYSVSDGVPLVSVGEIREGFLNITDHTPRVPEVVVRRLPQYVLRTGDIVFGRKGGVERSALIRPQQDGWFLGSDGIGIRPSKQCHDEYLAAQFQSHRVQRWLIQNAIGTTMPSLNQDILKRVAIPIPPTRAEQEAISRVLSDMGAEIATLEAKLAKARQIKEGMMHTLLTGRIRLI